MTASLFNTGDILRCSCVWRFGAAADQVNVLHLRVGTGIAGTNAGVMADIGLYFAAAYADPVTAMAPALVHNRIDVKNVTQDTLPGTIGSISALDGAGSGDGLPPDTTELVVFRTLFSRVMGRVYMPVFTEANVSNGAIGAGAIGALEAFGDYLLEEQNMVNGTDLQYCVRAASGTTMFPLTYRVIENTRKQARRQVGRGS